LLRLVSLISSIFCLILILAISCADAETAVSFFEDDFFKKEEQVFLDYPSMTRDPSGAYKGVIMANVISIDPQSRFMFIKPRERDLPRMYVFVDPFTRFSKSRVGTRKRTSISSVLEGDRVAARVFLKHGVIVADEIYLVEGDFEPPSRYEKKMYKKVPSTETTEKPDGEGGH
jgi:hypothetical protein